MKMWHGLAIAAALSTTVASPALAWWPRGGSGSGSGERTATGPEGQTWSSSGSATYGGGSGSGERTVTTPYGGSYSRSGSYSRW
jgi:hypothetical protein